MTELEGQPFDNVEELAGRELDEALASSRCSYGYCHHCQDEADEPCQPYIPKYHASLDALLRDIEPVCRERGMKGYSFESLSWMPAERRCRAYTEPWDGVDFEGPTAATALARAFLAVMERDR